MKDEDLIECPFCNSTEYIFEREDEIVIVNNPDAEFTDDYDFEHCRFFCGRCNKDF